MKYTLRPYQLGAATKAVEFFEGKSKKKPVLVLPTGAGKSLIIADIASKVVDKGNVLVLQPSKELLVQNYGKYISYGLNASLYSASVNKREVGQVTYATIGSVKTKQELFESVRFVIIDECDMMNPSSNGMYVSFLSKLNAKVIGLTATPLRLKQYSDPFTGSKYSKVVMINRMLPKFFNQILHVTQIKELLDARYLTKLKYYPMKFNATLLQPNTTGSDFSDESVQKSIELNNVRKRIPNICKQAISKGRAANLVFVTTINDAIEMSIKTPNSSFVHSKMKKSERDEAINGFKNGKYTTMYNVGILTTGFDFPSLDSIIIERATKSIRLFYQMIGRGTRLYEGKEYCTIVDFGGNIERFGKLEHWAYVEDEKGYQMYNLQNNKQITNVPLF